MKGYLYQLRDFGDEWLYWSLDDNLQDKIKLSYQDYRENADTDEVEFEDWFNFNFVTKIERVFVEEINI